MSYIPARVVPSSKRSVDEVQAKRFVMSCPVKFEAGPRKIFEEARVAANGVYDSLSGILGPSEDVPVVQD